MDDEEKRRQDRLLEIVIAHLARHSQKPPECPICHNSQWKVEPLVSHLLYTTIAQRPETEQQRLLFNATRALLPQAPQQDLEPTGLWMPAVQLVCKVCHLIYQFAWEPIRKEWESGGG